MECHRDPAAKIRPKEQVTNLDWKPGPGDKTVVGVFAKLPDLYERSQGAGVGTDELMLYSTDKKSSTQSNQKLAQAYVAKLAESDPGRLQREMGVELLKMYHVQPSTDCVTCHR